MRKPHCGVPTLSTRERVNSTEKGQSWGSHQENHCRKISVVFVSLLCFALCSQGGSALQRCICTATSAQQSRGSAPDPSGLWRQPGRYEPALQLCAHTHTHIYISTHWRTKSCTNVLGTHVVTCRLCSDSKTLSFMHTCTARTHSDTLAHTPALFFFLLVCLCFHVMLTVCVCVCGCSLLIRLH